MRKIKYLFVAVVIFVIFRKLFLFGPAVYGDAPYFYIDGLKELINPPMLWLSRGYSLGDRNQFLWIYPLMYLYGLLGTFFHLSNDLIVRILFYFPSLIFGFFGVILLLKHMKFSSTIYFFASLIYLINTYFLLVVDGGQIGVALAYGLFPLTMYFLIRFLDKPGVSNFLLSLVGSFILTVVDFRIAAICLLTVFLIRIDKTLKIKYLLLIILSLAGLSLYWIVPSLKLSDTISANQVSSLSNTSFLNTFLLSSPSWPNNEFGKSITPYFYFFIIPVLVFYPLFFLRDKRILRYTSIFLFMAFLAKGESYPLGIFYKIFVNTSFGSVFRDSTKFFIPLLIVGGILIGTTIYDLAKKYNKKIIYALFCLYFIFLVWQAVVGKLNGTLGKNIDMSDFQKFQQLVNEQKLVNEQNGFFRTAWFTEKSPFSPHTEEKQSLDAKDLVNFRPFASMNGGTGDRFNFINNPQYLDWFKLLGIKYLVLSGNPRVTKMNESDQKDWNRLNNLMARDNRLKKINLETSFPIYENTNIKPNKFFVDKTFLVVGGDDVYQKIKNTDTNFSISDQGFLFSEDGKFSLSDLQNLPSKSIDLIFNNKNENDLRMSFLQKDFVSSNEPYFSQWALRSTQDFLNWKYELLVNNISTHEFDFSKGIAFSSEANEELKFNMKVPTKGDYYLEVRSMNASGSGDLKVTFNKSEELIKRKTAGEFEWYEKGPITLDAGNYSLNLQNTNGFQVVNTVALVSSDDIKKANELTDHFMKKFFVVNLNNKLEQTKLTSILEEHNANSGWLIFTDSYNSGWNGSYPMYSAINGFYVNSEKDNFEIKYNGYQDLNKGIYLSILSLLIISGVTIFIYMNERKNKSSN